MTRQTGTGQAGRGGRERKRQASGPRRLDGTVLDVAAAARAARGLLPWQRWGGRVLFLREEMVAFVAALAG